MLHTRSGEDDDVVVFRAVEQVESVAQCFLVDHLVRHQRLTHRLPVGIDLGFLNVDRNRQVCRFATSQGIGNRMA